MAAAVGAGVRAVDSSIQVDELPMADGGEGTVEALVAATGGRLLTTVVTGPLADMRVDAVWGMLGDGVTAVIEMAAASGLALLRPEQYDPERTTTYGTGELLVAAARAGAKRIILGIGGSATVDGGLGCAQACGVRFEVDRYVFVEAGDAPLNGSTLAHAKPVEGSYPARGLAGVEIVVACDVDNPLIGERGAARVFGPQKGATPEQVARLDAGLAALSMEVGWGYELRERPGAGAAGGLGFGMLAFFGAKLRPGFGIVAEAVGLAGRVRGADLVITGEGRLDASSLGGKTAVGVARTCKAAGVPCVAVVGSVGEGAERAIDEGVTAYHAICGGPVGLEEAMRDAPRLLAAKAADVVRAIRAKR